MSATQVFQNADTDAEDISKKLLKLRRENAVLRDQIDR
jgi:hypothetical protein